MMHDVLATTTGLRTARQIRNVYQLGVPEYPRPLSPKDVAINIVTKLPEKAAIMQSTISISHIFFIL
jgi:phosphate acetyltransferase